MCDRKLVGQLPVRLRDSRCSMVGTYTETPYIGLHSNLKKLNFIGTVAFIGIVAFSFEHDEPALKRQIFWVSLNEAIPLKSTIAVQLSLE